MTEDVLNEVGSVAELAALIDGQGWTERLDAVGTDIGAYDSLYNAIERLRLLLWPEQQSPELTALKDQVLADPNADLAPLLGRIAELRAALPLDAYERLFARIGADLEQRFHGPALGSGARIGRGALRTCSAITPVGRTSLGPSQTVTATPSAGPTISAPMALTSGRPSMSCRCTAGRVRFCPAHRGIEAQGL